LFVVEAIKQTKKVKKSNQIVLDEVKRDHGKKIVAKIDFLSHFCYKKVGTNRKIEKYKDRQIKCQKM